MLVVYNSSKRACDKCLQSVLFLLLVFSFVLPNVDIKSKVGLLFFFQCFLFSPQLVDKTITKVIVLVCVCKSSQLLPVSKVDKIFTRWCFLKTVLKWMSFFKWPLYDLFWPFFCHMCVYLSQNLGSDGHLPSMLTQNNGRKMPIFVTPCILPSHTGFKNIFN